MTHTETITILRRYNKWRRGNLEGRPMPDPREIGEAIDAAIEMIERLEAAEKERDELRAKLEAAEKSDAESIAMYRKARDERDALRAKIESMERQEPYSYIYEYSNPIDGSPVWRNVPCYWNAQFPKSSKPLYALPGAQPAPENCPCCGEPMRVYSRCSNSDCEAVTVTPEQARYNKALAFARTVATRMEDQTAPSVTDEEAAYSRWFHGEQDVAYDGMWAFARAAWMARAALAASPEAKP